MAEASSVRDVFERHMPERLKSKPDLVTKINAVYQFNISGPGGGQWAVDCATPGGVVTAGTVTTARCTVACADGDFLNIVNGKLKIQGDMGLALKLAQLLG